jgi:hypothetical protein
VKPTEVDPAQLAKSARALSVSADDMAAQLADLKATVTAGNPWGQDEQGSLFGLAYGEVLQQAIEVYDSHVDQLMYAAENLATWAEKFELTEADIVRGFQLIWSKLRGEG